MGDKISVIVPIYNVEKFLEKCIKSIVNQTYKNLEIILVDDGATDNSGKICDEFSKKDKRIKVIHKINGGLSDARNTGIQAATGKYISFIDSDDWIEDDLYENIVKENVNDSDIITFGIFIDYDNGKTITKTPFEKEILDNKTGLIYLNSYKNIDVSACNKIYKKELFSDIVFPVGKYCEDYYIMYKIFDKAKKIMVLPYAKYHYFQRINSITKNKRVNMDYLYASKAQMEYINKNHPDISYIGKTNYVFANISIYNMKAIRGLLNNKFDKKELINECKKHKKDIIFNKYLSSKKKIQYIIFTYFNWIYYIIICISKKNLV